VPAFSPDFDARLAEIELWREATELRRETSDAKLADRADALAELCCAERSDTDDILVEGPDEIGAFCEIEGF